MMNKKAPKTLLTLLALCLASVAWAGNAKANSANCDVLEIKASNGPGKIAPSLKELAGKLKKPPFSAWKEFSLVKKHSANAEQMKAHGFKLSDGSKLSLLYKDRSDSQGKKPRLRVGMTLDNAKGKRKLDVTLKVDSGDFTLMGRDAAKDGSSHLLAVRCSVK